MKVTKAKNSLIVEGRHFDAEKTLSCGQLFRFKPYNGGYLLNSGGELAVISQKGECTEILCTDEDYFYRYFDFDTDYAAINENLKVEPMLNTAVAYGEGIRILKQQKFETVISFIISANNNIKRISKIIENICSALGEKKVFNGISYCAFPTAEALANAGEDFFRQAGAGYRAPYLVSTAKAIAQGFDLDTIGDLNVTDAENKLLSLYGIGKKVCNCILLFAYGYTDIFPVDTWIEKVYYDCFCNDGKRISREKISERLVSVFGKLAGYAQQYLFYYKRTLKGDANYEIIP